jgi:NAD(P)H dehydrogenase (quinone)
MWNPLSVYIVRKVNEYTSWVNTPPVSQSEPRRNVLVIHCHPNPKSFSTSISNTVVESLRESGHTVRLRRLYLHDDKSECYMGKTFDPALSYEEREQYNHENNSVLRLTEQGLKNCPAVLPDIIEAVADLRWCDSLVFVYPTWWFNFPAVLKGFFDRVFLPGVSFALPATELNNSGAKSPVTGLVALLPNITKIGVVTTYGASPFATFLCGTWDMRGWYVSLIGGLIK